MSFYFKCNILQCFAVDLVLDMIYGHFYYIDLTEQFSCISTLVSTKEKERTYLKLYTVSIQW